MSAKRLRSAMTVFGAVFAAVSVLGTLSACKGGDEDSSSRRPDRGSNQPKDTGRACEWIPANATEVTPVASLHADKDNDPMCVEPASSLDMPKSVVVAMERELRESTKMSDADEAKIGARLEAALPREKSFRGKLDLPEDVQRYKGYVSDIVQNLAAKSSRPNVRYRVHTVRSPVFNAAALPGGVILVFTGTLEGKNAVRDEAELAGVLGHEISHVERRHVVAAYQYARAVAGDDSDETVMIMRLLTQPLSTEHELEADDRGMELMTLAGYDPQAVVNLWRRNARAERGEGHGGGEGRGEGGHRRGRRRQREGRDVVSVVMEGVEALMRSHPPSSVRACHAMGKLAWAREHAPCDRLYDGKSNLQTHVAGPRQPH